MDSGLIDIHSHILYGVDDGASSREVSIEMLREAARQGVTDIIATPHYRQGMFSYPPKKIFSHYQELRREAHKVGIRLSLGCEYFVDGDIYENLEKGRVPTLAGTRYVLTEYAPEAAYSMVQVFSQNLLRQGYIPVIATIGTDRIWWPVTPTICSADQSCWRNARPTWRSAREAPAGSVSFAKARKKSCRQDKDEYKGKRKTK